MGAEIWVAPSGIETNAGSKEAPIASLGMALRKAREMRRLKQAPTNEPIRIILHGGVYQLNSPVFVRPEDSGTETSPTIIEAASGERPVLSGGVPVEGWKRNRSRIAGLPTTARKEVWISDAPLVGGRVLEFRQLYVNGRKAVRAREPDGEALNRLVVWDRQKEEAWIAAEAARWKLVPRVEMIIHQQWEIAMLRIKSLDVQGDKARVTFHEPESRIQFEHPWPQPVMSTNGNAPFFLANAIEFLDEPGEWYQEWPGGRVIYRPRPGEDTATATVIVPALETLVRVQGSLDRPVAHVHFRGISFQHTTWMRPSEQGHVPLQASMFMLDSYKLSPKGTPDWRSLDNQTWIGRPPAAVSVKGAHHTSFKRCRFEHLASAGLDYEGGTRDDLIEGCVFRDIGGNGIQMGKFSDPGIETHLPYDPADEREVCARERIANNLVTDCANEDWGCVGIIVGYGQEVIVEHNEINNVSYTGINMGWGWTRTTNCMSDNIVRANHIHHVATRMCDTAGIYTLSCQPGTVVSENSIHSITMSPYVFNPKHWFYLYLDEGSSYITVRDNWCPEERFLRNANGPGNVWTNNGPTVSDTIKNAAGLQPEFRDLLSETK